jgi:citrate synthase
MLVATAAFAAAEPRSEPSVEMARSRAPSLLRRLVASCGLVSGADAVTASLEAKTAARALLVALRGRTTASAMAAVTEALVLCADHELNASTFAARVAASAGANLPACVMGGLGALSGPLHGAATARVEALVTEIARPERASAIVGERLARGESVPGFGHPLYPEGDPRGAHLLEVAARAGGKARGVRVITSVVNAMDLVAREKPTVDVGLVALASALGLPRGAPLAIFACGRIAGFIAHALEQRAAGFLLRPRARYVGA